MNLKETLEKMTLNNGVLNLEQLNSDFTTYLKLEGTMYIMGAVVDSQGNYILLYAQQTQEGGTYGAKIYLVKISPDGSEKEAEIIYEGKEYIEIPMAIEIDEDDNVYVAGMAIKIPDIKELINLIIVILMLILNGEFDEEDIPIEFLKAFILKFDSKNMSKDSQPINAAHFGGTGINIAFDLTDDNKGNIWVTGMTNSNNFPITTNVKTVYQSKNRGSYDGFICKFDSELNMEYSTYVGGKIKDVAQSIYADVDGNVYVTGVADNIENEEDVKDAGYFNVTPNAFQKTFGGGLSDSFIIKLRNDGQAVYCSYLGGKDTDNGVSVTADDLGNAYVTGATGKDFPIRGNAYQKELGLETQGIFIAKINANGTALTNSTFLGGSYKDSSKTIRFMDDGVYIYGSTASKDFPTVAKSYRPVYFGQQDVFFSKLSTDLSTLEFSSFFGGSKREAASDMIVLKDGSYVLLGETLSRDIPISEDAIDKVFYNAKGEGFLGKFTAQDFSYIVNFTDEKLKSELCEILNKDPNENITEYELKKMPRYVDLSNKEISSIEGIQYANYILGLDLSNNKIEGVDLLSQITYLNYLDLNNTGIKDLSPLGNLTDISYLYIRNNSIDDISSLQGLVNITELRADNNNISTIDAMNKMDRVRTVTLDNNSIGDLSVLKNSCFLSKVSAISQNISKNISKKSFDNAVLKLDFLKKIDSTLPTIIDISNNGVLDIKNREITWSGITEDITVSFKFEGIDEEYGIEYMNGEVLVSITNDNTGIEDGDLDDTDTIVFSTFLGFETSGNLTKVVTDSEGNFYVLYNEYETITIGDSKYPKAKSIMIKKISADGKTLLGAMEIADDNKNPKLRKVVVGNNMTIDSNDDIYIVGNTNWTELPTTSGVVKEEYDVKTDYSISTEGFIMKFKGENFKGIDNLIYCTFLGGKGSDNIKCVAVENDGDVWVGGRTTSENFPITEDTAYQPKYSGLVGKLFFTKLNNNFSKIEYSTFLGAQPKKNNIDYGDFSLGEEAIDDLYDIKLDKDGNLYGTGAAEYILAPEYRPEVMKDMKQNSWKLTKNAYQKKFGGGDSDAFVVKFKPNGEVVYVTYLGGTTMDVGVSMDIDDNGCLYILGFTGGDFIMTGKGYSKVYDVKEGGMFLSKFNAEGNEIIGSTYFGGSYWNFTKAIKVQGDNVYIVGSTDSLDFETTESAFQKIFNGGTQGFLSIFNSELSKLKYSTFIEGSVTEEVNNLLVDKDGSIILGGGTSSPDFPVTANVYKEEYSDNEAIPYIYGDGFLMKMNVQLDS